MLCLLSVQIGSLANVNSNHLQNSKEFHPFQPTVILTKKGAEVMLTSKNP